jgi:prepilin-type N-terminal cleavage/methylation domain-containing protein
MPFWVAKLLFSNVKNRKNQGFTLIELCIAMTVISLILVGVMTAYKKSRINADKVATTADLRETITRALSEFVTTNGRYPCPANPALASGNANYGKEGSCTATGTNPLIGALPTAALNIPEEFALDKWSRKYTYVVSPTLVTGPILPTANGTINLSYRYYETTIVGGETRQTGNLATLTPLKQDGSQKRFQALVISAGENGLGAFTASGGPIPTAYVCPTTGTIPLEATNCDGNNTFVVTVKSSNPTAPPDINGFHIYGTGANYYDDLVLAIEVPITGIWQAGAKNASEQHNIYTKAAGVGVGVQNPQTQLDVSGNVRATEAKSSQVCSLSDGTKCFDPNIIGGSRPSQMSCTDAPVVKIRNSTVVCGNIIEGPPGVRCPVGQYVTGFGPTGNIICG